MNLQKHIWEGWKVIDFINELEWLLDTIQNGRSHINPITTKEGLKKWCMENQPHYKKHIPDVYNYFLKKYKIK